MLVYFVREEEIQETAVQLPFEDNRSEPPGPEGHARAMKCSQPNKPWFEYWFAAQVSMRLCCVSILLRFRTLPELLEQLTTRVGQRGRRTRPTLDRAVQIVVRVCHFRLFRGPLFPRPCLRQALTLYDMLTYLGYPVTIHFGILKTGNQLSGHSWVTLDGKPIAENGDPGASHRIVYSYPSNQPGFAQDVAKMLGSNAKLF
jgi:transglutaminase superfamily protein